MFTVILNRSDFEYDIHSLVKAFFPEEDVTVVVSEDVISGISPSGISESSVPAQGCSRPGTSESSVPSQTYGFPVLRVTYLPDEMGFLWECVDGTIYRVTSEKVNFSDRIHTKNVLKRTLYQMFAEVTGKTLPWGTLTGIRPTKIPMKLLEEGKSRREISTYMRETYLASEKKVALALDIAAREGRLLQNIDYENGYSLYIGIPFCPTTCLYCSFPSFPLTGGSRQIDAYLDALEKEMTFAAGAFSEKKLNTVYIGGGTPTTLEPSALERLLKKIKSCFDLSDCTEFTVEAGRPDSITEEKLLVLKREGVSRISINPQTMNEKTLKLIGRHHTVKQVVESFHPARVLGFDNINMDLIIGLPGETLDDVHRTLEAVAELRPDSLTVHSLALKRAAKLNIFKEDYINYKTLNTQEHMDLAAEYAASMGLSPYYLYRQKGMAGNLENVGYAANGKESLYNILIMEEVQSIVALGAGTVTKRVYPDGRIKRCDNVKDVALYIEKIDEMIERKRRLFENV